MNPKKSKLYVGTIGFSYDQWANGVFFPSNVPRSEWLAYYSQHFNSVEIAHTFSKVPEKEIFIQWHGQTGSDFKFCLRGNQYITHVKKLKGVGEPLKLFMDPALKLKEKLSAVVWEIPQLGREQTKLLEAFAKHLQKYPGIKHFFDFKKDMIPEQKTLQVLQENNFEVISQLPQDSVIEKRHYFHVSSYDTENAPEWENDLLKNISKTDNSQSFYIYFDDPQGGYSLKNAKAFLKKI